MNFVDEQHVARLQPGQYSGHIAGSLNSRAGGDFYIHPHFVGDHMGQGGLAQAGRAVDDDVIQGFAPQLGRLDSDAQVVFNRVLAHEIRQSAGPQRKVRRVIPLLLGARNQSFGGS